MRYDPWIWVDGPGALCSGPGGKFFEILPTAPVINEHACARYGLSKTFVRTGQWADGDGDGFLRCYSEANIDTLERDGGMALVYTHLDAKWLDPASRRMRTDIEERLRYVAGKPGWFAPAGEMLDRARAVETLHVAGDERTVSVTQRGDASVGALLVRAPALGQEVTIAAIAPGQTVTVPLMSRVRE